MNPVLKTNFIKWDHNNRLLGGNVSSFFLLGGGRGSWIFLNEWMESFHAPVGSFRICRGRTVMWHWCSPLHRSHTSQRTRLHQLMATRNPANSPVDMVHIPLCAGFQAPCVAWMCVKPDMFWKFVPCHNCGVYVWHCLTMLCRAFKIALACLGTDSASHQSLSARRPSQSPISNRSPVFSGCS